MELYRRLFSKDLINKGRQPELDMAKAVIIFFLPFIHCIIECTPEEKLVSGIPYLFDSIIGGPLAAPMFMFAMGIGLIYTKHNSVSEHARRGLQLLIIGFVLNLFRYTIPYLIGFLITSDTDKFITPILYRTLCNDILQFAGIAIMVIALLQYFKIPDIFMLILGVGMSIIGTMLNGIDVNNPIGNIFLGYLLGTEDAAGMVFSDFPLLNWFIVPVTGYLFGKLLMRVKDKKYFYTWLSPICICITVVYFYIGIKYERGMFGEGQNCYYHISTDDVLVSIMATIGMISIDYFICRFIPSRIMYWIHDISRNITYIYCIHWVIVVLITNLLLYCLRGTQELSVPATMLLSLLISITAITISHLWKKRMKNKNSKEKCEELIR